MLPNSQMRPQASLLWAPVQGQLPRGHGDMWSLHTAGIRRFQLSKNVEERRFARTGEPDKACHTAMNRQIQIAQTVRRIPVQAYRLKLPENFTHSVHPK